MKPLVVLYATRHGQTRRIAEHIQTLIRDRGHSARLRDVREIHEPVTLERYSGVGILTTYPTAYLALKTRAQKIAAILKRLMAGREIPDFESVLAANRKQAMVPAGAVVLDPVGTAPGVIVPGDGHGRPAVTPADAPELGQATL